MRFQEALTAGRPNTGIDASTRLAVDDPASARIRLAKITPIVKFTPLLMIVTVAGAGIICAASGGHPKHRLIYLWASCVVVYALVALGAWGRSRLRAGPQRMVSARGVRRFVLQIAILGCLGGALPAVILPSADTSLRILMVGFVAGMIGCGSFATLTLPAATLAYTGPVFAGALLGFLWSGDPTLLTLSALLVVCYLLITTSCFAQARIFSDHLVAAEDLQRQKRGVSAVLRDFEATANDWFWEVDVDGRLTYVSERLATAAGVAPEVLTGVPLATLCQPGPRDSVVSLDKLIQTQTAFAGAIVAVRVGDALRTWSLSAKPIVDVQGRAQGFRGIGVDVTDAQAAQSRITELSHFDPLTQLPNRASFLQALAAAVGAAPPGEGCAVLCLDLDNFQTLNETLGHPVGDAVLTQTAQRLRQVVGERGSVARLSGDKFAVLVAPAPPEDALRELAGRILQDLARPFLVNDQTVPLGASMGVAITPRDAGDAGALLKSADLALYRSKSEGKGGFSFFEPAMNALAQERRALEIDLRAALTNGELMLYYQPLIDCETHEITGFEALIRWNHPRRGIVSPIDFIPWAEKWGLITRIGEWVLHEACRNATCWPSEMTVAVNLSPIQFIGGELINQVSSALQASGLAPSRLELEITEGILLNETERTLAQLAKLKSLGVKIAMDDFGTGYSSLAYLWKFPFDKIKIDRSFIAEMHQNEAIVDILRTITALGRTLRLKVTAEGVETADQVRMLTAMSCDNFQGYLFGRPMPVAAVPAFILNDLARRLRREEISNAAAEARS